MDIFGNLPDGLEPGSDRGPLLIGTVIGVDGDAKQVQVTVGASDPLWVPAAPDIYVVGAKVRLERSAIAGGRAFYCLGALDNQPEIVSGVVSAVNSGTGTLSVTCLGSSYTLPYVTGTYSVSTTVHVQRSLKQFGMPVLVLGPQGSFAGSGGTQDSGGSSNPGRTETRQATIRPQWSGSYRAGNGWDRWNTDRYGGRSTLWQGNAFGSGNMTGLATFGDQIVNLGATAITSMVVAVTRADSSSSSGKAPRLQPSTDSSQPGGAPSVGGSVVTGGSVTVNATTYVTLDSGDYAAFLAGTYKGIATVSGGDYGGFYGTARGDGFALTIQYTVVV